MNSDLYIDPNTIEAMAKLVSDRMIQARATGGHEGAMKLAEQLRAPFGLSDLGNSASYGQAKWADQYQAPILNSVAEREAQNLFLDPGPPGERSYNGLIFNRTGLQAAGTTPTSTNPTPYNRKVTPVTMHYYTEIDEAAFLRMIYQFDRARYVANPQGYELSENEFLTIAIKWAALASLFNTCINGDTHSVTPSLAHFDGWIHNALANCPAGLKWDTAASVDYMGTIFPGMRAKLAAVEPRHLLQDDLYIYCSIGVMFAYFDQVTPTSGLAAISGWSKDPRDPLRFGNIRIFGLTDMPDNRMLLTRRANLPIPIVDDPMLIDYEWSLTKGRVHVFSAPVKATTCIVDYNGIVIAGNGVA